MDDPQVGGRLLMELLGWWLSGVRKAQTLCQDLLRLIRELRISKDLAMRQSVVACTGQGKSATGEEK